MGEERHLHLLLLLLILLLPKQLLSHAPSNLLSPPRQHTGERPHLCPLCGWQARDHNTMRRHTMGHQNLKPFRCPDAECGLKTRNATYFRRHMAKRHPDNEAPFKCEVRRAACLRGVEVAVTPAVATTFSPLPRFFFYPLQDNRKQTENKTKVN